MVVSPKSAEDGVDAEHMFKEGVLAYNFGDDGMAITWFTRAAEAGHPAAMYNLGLIAHDSREIAAGDRWLLKAAQAGHANAAYALAKSIRESGGDAEAVAFWLSRARRNEQTKR